MGWWAKKLMVAGPRSATTENDVPDKEVRAKGAKIFLLNFVLRMIKISIILLRHPPTPFANSSKAHAQGEIPVASREH
jgi:hypothetical protein